MPEMPPWYDVIPFPALLRWSRGTYGEAMRKALAEAGYDDIPPNGMHVVGGLAIAEDREIGPGRPPGVPLGPLMKALKLSKQAGGQLVDTLVLRGYLEREADPADRRRLTVVLTERGRHVAQVQREAREKIDAELERRVGAPAIAASRKTLGALVEMGPSAEDEQ